MFEKFIFDVAGSNTARGGEAWQLTVSALALDKADSAGRDYIKYDPLRLKNLADQDAVRPRVCVCVCVCLKSSLFYSDVIQGGF